LIKTEHHLAAAGCLQ